MLPGKIILYNTRLNRVTTTAIKPADGVYYGFRSKLQDRTRKVPVAGFADIVGRAKISPSKNLHHIKGPSVGVLKPAHDFLIVNLEIKK